MARKINLNSIYYDVIGDTLKRPINPLKGKLGSAGLEYSDFQKAQLEEWHDFRNGIGLETELPTESARLWWSEGVDFTTARSAVLGPLVTTAGAFGVAPVKIIDFGAYTIGIGNNVIKYWVTSWGTVSAATSLVIEDCEDVWVAPDPDCSCAVSTDNKVGTNSIKLTISGGDGIANGAIIAYEDMTAVNISGYTYLRFWIKSENAKSAGDIQIATDEDLAIASSQKVDIPALEANKWYHIDVAMTAASGDLDAVRSVGLVNASGGSLTSEVIYVDDVKVTTSGAIANPIDAIVVTDQTDEYLIVSSATDAAYTTNGTTWLHLGQVQGYMEWFAGKLYSMDTDGKTVRYSKVNNCDAYDGEFTLTGGFGTIYGLFEAKLLAESTTATLYMYGNKGIWAIDITNELAYRQEINYPPYTYAGHSAMYYNANIYVATGAGIVKVGANMAVSIGTDKDDGLPKTYQGYVSDMVGVGDWILNCVNRDATTDKSSIFKRNTSYGGNLQIYSTATADVAIPCLHYSPSSKYTNGRLWFGEGTNIKYIELPDLSSNVKQVADYHYVDDSGKAILPTFRKLAAIPKIALGLKAITKSCDTDEYINVWYRIDDDCGNAVASNWSEIVTSASYFQSSPLPTALAFNSGLGTAFHTIQFAFQLIRKTADTTNSPELESLMFYYIPDITPIYAWTFKVRCTDEDSAITISAFETLLDTGTLVAFYPSGNTAQSSYNVKITGLSERMWHENEGRKEAYIEVEVSEIFNG